MEKFETNDYYKLEREPTTLSYLRRRSMLGNAIFSGLLPVEMERQPQYWKTILRKVVKPI
jgi:hypothetical protein